MKTNYPNAKSNRVASTTRWLPFGWALALMFVGAPWVGRAACNYTLAVPTGVSLVANQCDSTAAGGNTLNNVFPGALPGSQIIKWNNGTQMWEPPATFNGVVWTPNLTLNPGEGAYFISPGPQTFAISGNPHTFVPLVLPANGWCIASRQTPLPGNFNDIAGTPQPGDTVYIITPGQGAASYVFDPDLGGWDPSDPPMAGIGQSIWICRGATGQIPNPPACPCPFSATAPVPPNDNPCGILPLLSAGVFYGYTFNANPSPSGSLAPAPCGISAGSPDVWYTFTAPCPGGNVTLDTCFNPCFGYQQGGSSIPFDTVLSVYTGGCPLFSQIVCGDDNAACTAAPLSSKVTFLAKPCVTYYVRVSGKQGATGCFALNVGYTPVLTAIPGNNVCANATVIKCNETKSFNTCMATAGGPTTGPCTFGKDLWYKYTPTSGGMVSVDTCGSFFDTVLGVYTGPCNNLIQLACNNDASTGPCASTAQSYLTFLAAANTTYFIRVGGNNGEACTGKLTVIGPNPPLGTCPPNNCGVKRQRLFQVVGTSTGNAWSWCLSSPGCFNINGTVAAGTVPSGQPASALVAAMVASINSVCPGTAVQFTGNNASSFKIKACICANCPSLFPFVFRVGAAGALCEDMCVVNSPIIVSATGPCVFNPGISEVPLSGQDCNQNGEDDMVDILNGTSQDSDGNGVPDGCPIRLDVAYEALNDEVVISWPARDTILEQSTSVAGPWGEVLGAASPHVVGPPTGQTFFRLRLP